MYCMLYVEWESADSATTGFLTARKGGLRSERQRPPHGGVVLCKVHCRRISARPHKSSPRIQPQEISLVQNTLAKRHERALEGLGKKGGMWYLTLPTPSYASFIPQGPRPKHNNETLTDWMAYFYIDSLYLMNFLSFSSTSVPLSPTAPWAIVQTLMNVHVTIQTKHALASGAL